MSILMPHFAGTWYPDSRGACLKAFAGYEAAGVRYRGEERLRGGLVPHAGWTFSGRLAFNVFREVAASAAGYVDTVVLFGGHQGPSSQANILEAGEIWTPLGGIMVDEELTLAILDEGGELRRRTTQDLPKDNTLELQYPFIRHFLPSVGVVIVTPPASPAALSLAAQVVQAANRLGRGILAMGSTDLTHYGPNYGWAPMGSGPAAEQWVRQDNDRRFIERALRLDGAGMIQHSPTLRNACCPGAAAAAVECGRLLDSPAGTLLSYATSADVMAGDSFVGYAALVF